MEPTYDKCVCEQTTLICSYTAVSGSRPTVTSSLCTKITMDVMGRTTWGASSLQFYQQNVEDTVTVIKQPAIYEIVTLLIL